MITNRFDGPLEPAGNCCWRIPKSYKPGMLVDGLIFANDRLIDSIRKDQAPEQVANVAFLPGIQQASLAMPDIHWGYGFCIGGVCATDPEEGGVISPGGVGYDINCGVRLVRSNLHAKDVRPRLAHLIDRLFSNVPAGTGRGGKYRYKAPDLKRLLAAGPAQLVEWDLATEDDILHTEAAGCLADARPEFLSERAISRGFDQCGTLGSGNHFLEVQLVDEVFDHEAAGVMNLAEGMVCVMIHSGSRGLGYQVCDDSLKELRGTPAKYSIKLPDRQLVCAPVDSPEGRRYLAQMRAAANFAWGNRQILTHLARQTFAKVLGRSAESIGMHQIYDVAHNIAKIETYQIDGRPRRLCVHRKGATRAFPPGHPEVPEPYRNIGQPVLIPGDMGRESYVLVGTQAAMTQTFGSTCHGAGRALSRTAALRQTRNRNIARELSDKGIIVRAKGKKTLGEEASEAYKNVAEVVDVMHDAGVARKVARLRPIAVMKG